MAQFVSSGGQQSVSIQGASNPQVSNIALVTANTEVEIILPAGCKKYMLKLRDKSALKLAFISGDSGLVYITIWPGCVYSENSLDVTTTSLYVQSPVASQIVELVTWT